MDGMFQRKKNSNQDEGNKNIQGYRAKQKCPAPASNFQRDQRIAVLAVRELWWRPRPTLLSERKCQTSNIDGVNSPIISCR